MPKTYSQLTNSSQHERPRYLRGFTLIEILLVIALLGLLASAVLPRVDVVFRAGIQASVRRFSALVRYSYDQSILTGRVHRIVLDLDKQNWSLEIADVGLLPTEQQADDRNRDDKEKAKGPNQGFKKVGKNLTGAMPRGVEIVEVESWRLGKQPVTKGSVAIYSYPTGYIDEASVIVSEKGKNKIQHYKITTESLTGRTTVLAETQKQQGMVSEEIQ